MSIKRKSVLKALSGAEQVKFISEDRKEPFVDN
jgi:hypothetical protein